MESTRLFVATIFVISGIVIQFMVKQTNEIPTFFIDLDREPMERFKEVAERYSFGIQIAVKNYKNAMTRQCNMTFDELDSIVKNLGKQFPQEYREEMVGVAKYAKMDVSDVYFLHVHYELSTMCTTILCVDNENVVWMLRNFDYIRAKDLKAIAVTLDFQRKNRSIFKGTTFAGVIGLTNGVKRDGFSFAINRRMTRDGTLEGNLRIAAAQARATGHVWPTTLLARRILEKERVSFEEVVKELSRVPFMAPAYITIGGRKNDEGVIITRDQNRVVTTNSLDIAHGTWFVAITNTDYGSKPWKNDWRYHAAHKAMTKLIRAGINDEKAWRVLKASYYKKSVFSSLMSVETYYVSSVLAS